jgi:hypothetical protein
MKQSALIIFVKAPILGRVKTRLSPHLSQREILRLYKSFLRTITERCSRLDRVDRFLGCTPTKDDDFLSRLAGQYGYGCFDQRGKTLGERLINAFRDHFDTGYKKVVIIGSDSPTIPLEYIKDAFTILNKKEFVLGPCNDGGYYLVGARRLYERVFRRIPWDTSEVLNKTLDRLNSGDIDYYLLPFWYDVDRIEDMMFYKRHLKYLKKAGNDKC